MIITDLDCDGLLYYTDRLKMLSCHRRINKERNVEMNVSARSVDCVISGCDGHNGGA